MKSSLRLNTDSDFIKVLIVENINYSKNILKKEFKAIGLFTLSAMSCKEALEKIERYKPDLLTISHELEDASLVDFLDRVKSNSKTKILFVSSRTSTDLLEGKLEILIDSVISLPIKGDYLKGVISQLLYKNI